MDVPTGPGLYAAHKKIYPREVRGRFARLRVLAVIVLLGLFYGLPWLRWNGRQALLFDLPARKFYIFGLTLFPQDFYLLTWLLIMAALSLFFFTALAGRLWCGYACPQTVWTEIFVWMERLTEGNRSQQMKLDRAPWSRAKFARKAAKQILWLGFAAFTGMTFVGYFSPIHAMPGKILGGGLGGWELFWVLFYGTATYGFAGHLREQVCLYMCPYARFQSAMFDRNTLIISYDAARGEPRGAATSQRRRPNCRPGRLHRLHAVRAGLPHRHRHPQGPAVRVHRVCGVHRRMRRCDEEGRLAAGPGALWHAIRDRRQADARHQTSNPHLFDAPLQPDVRFRLRHRASQPGRSGRAARSKHPVS